nr:immunoglobulin heavy chain junction region [Macaca mulatta]
CTRDLFPYEDNDGYTSDWGGLDSW